jgi:hypothetical protein
MVAPSGVLLARGVLLAWNTNFWATPPYIIPQRYDAKELSIMTEQACAGVLVIWDSGEFANISEVI